MPDRREPTLTVRMSTVERDVRDHSKSLSAIIEAAGRTDGRIQVLEEAHRNRLIMEARESERDIIIKETLASIKQEIKEIRGVGTKILWVIGLSVLGSFIAFVLRGGLAPL